MKDADSFEICVEAGDADIAQYLADNGFANQTVNEVMEAKNASGETIGYALNMTTSEGYGEIFLSPWAYSLMEL